MKTQNEKKTIRRVPALLSNQRLSLFENLFPPKPKTTFLMFFLSLLNISHKPGKKRIQRQIFADQQKTV